MNPRAKKLSAKESFSILKRIVSLMFKSYPLMLLLAVFCILVSSAAGVIGNVFIGDVLIDQFITPSLKGEPTALYGVPMDLSTLVIIMAGIYLFGVICTYFYQILVSQIGQGTQKKLRDELFAKMEKLPLSYFDNRPVGDIMSVYTNDIDALREMISRVLPMLVQSLITMVASLAAMIMLKEWQLILVVIAFLFIIVFVVLSVTKRSSKYFIGQQRYLGLTNGYIEEMISGQKVIKVFNHEKEVEEGFDKLNDELCHHTTKAVQFSNILGPVVNNLANLQYVILALIGGLSIAYGVMNSPGVILSYMQLGRSFTMPISQLAMNINMLIMAMAGGYRIFELMDSKPEKDDGYVTLVNAVEDENGNPVETDHFTGKWAWKHPHTDGSGTDFTWLKGKIDLYNVDFGYVPEKIVLHDISLYAKPGQKVAFVGPTGAGKTTVTNLLNRFYDIEDGKIRFDDININKIKKADLRRALGMVLQETNLFTGTVADNIAYGNPNATREDVIKAAELANADNFIRMLPEGYDTVLYGAGAGLSQGQRQLLSIARAACANPPVLVLDEATSSIDSRTEALVQKGMDAIMKGRTVFVIAHRLSTVKNSNVIIVLEGGHIIERGDHDALLAQKGKYYQLYTGGQVTAE
ncbi:MAG: ABC transporter ATP-binding protein [Bacilli bacterium]|nr:ABC transporter ATP-binding protein [Bacilli bacterium]